MSLVNIQPLITNNVPPAARVIVDLGINPKNNMHTVVTHNCTLIDEENELVRISFTVRLYSVLSGNVETIVNKFESISTASNVMVDYTGTIDPAGPITEFMYFKYIMSQSVSIPSLTSIYATELFNRGRFDVDPLDKT